MLTIENFDNLWNPGVFIDIDGVLLQGGKPFEWSKEAIHALWKNEIPFLFLTNGTYCSAVLTETLSKILDLPLTTDHVVVAPSPCLALTNFHNKRVLVCCQDDSLGLINELGFNDYLTIEDLVKIFPELDYVDHKRRKIILNTPVTLEQQKAQNEFKPVEAILLLGEPVNWECSLQVLIDILMTNGDPRAKSKSAPTHHLPIICCNKDLTFKGAADLPRFGHGAFLECLEALYLKITKTELVYQELMGKPYLITYEFAADQIQKQSKNGKPVNKFYIIGDNPDVDVRGANTFKSNLQLYEPIFCNKLNSNQINQSLESDIRISNQVESILVCTGVYNPYNDLLLHLKEILSERKEDLTNEFMDSSVVPVSEKKQSIKRHDSNSSLVIIDIDENVTKTLLNDESSYVNYFENKLNIPDLTVNNLKDAVDYIIRSCLL